LCSFEAKLTIESLGLSKENNWRSILIKFQILKIIWIEIFIQKISSESFLVFIHFQTWYNDLSCLKKNNSNFLNAEVFLYFYCGHYYLMSEHTHFGHSTHQNGFLHSSVKTMSGRTHFGERQNIFSYSRENLKHCKFFFEGKLWTNSKPSELFDLLFF